MPDPEIIIENIQDLLCNIKEAMTDVFMPRTELNTTYAQKNHTHPIDSSLDSTSTNPVQNKAVKAKTDSIESALTGKSDTNHTHAEASASSAGFLSSTLFSKLSNIATGATKNDPSTNNPLMDGTADKGSETNYARGDHVHPTDTSRAPTSHASSATTYGASSASNYGHAMASGTTPKALAASGSVGSETAKFARGDHVHPLPAVAASNANGLMSKEDKSKLDAIQRAATCNNLAVKLNLSTPADSNNGPIINIVRNTNLNFSILSEFDDAVPSNYKVKYSLNGQVYERSHGGTHKIELNAGDYHMDMIFSGGGVYNPVYRCVTLRVTA